MEVREPFRIFSQVDPFLASLYSVAFPITYLRSILPAGTSKSELSRFKHVYKLMSILGSLVLLFSLYSVTFLVQRNQLKQSPFSRIRRYHVKAKITITCTIGDINTILVLLYYGDPWAYSVKKTWISGGRQIDNSLIVTNIP